MGERLNGIQEVVGSIPIVSTMNPLTAGGWRVFPCPHADLLPEVIASSLPNSLSTIPNCSQVAVRSISTS